MSLPKNFQKNFTQILRSYRLILSSWICIVQGCSYKQLPEPNNCGFSDDSLPLWIYWVGLWILLLRECRTLWVSWASNEVQHWLFRSQGFTSEVLDHSTQAIHAWHVAKNEVCNSTVYKRNSTWYIRRFSLWEGGVGGRDCLCQEWHIWLKLGSSNQMVECVALDDIHVASVFWEHGKRVS